MRTATRERKTLETEIFVNLNLDGSGKRKISTGMKFFDHMLEQFAAHGHFDLEISAKSLDSDTHHILEDCAITLGEAFKEALAGKKGIKRYGSAIIPMDESLVLSVVDLSGRPFCSIDVPIEERQVSDFETVLLKHFFNSFAIASASTLHLRLLNGEDTHHKIEATFKSFARALCEAVSIDEKHADETPSTKGIL